MRCVIGGDAYLHFITFQNLDPVFFHAAGEDTLYDDLIITCYFHCPAPQNSGYRTFQLD